MKILIAIVAIVVAVFTYLTLTTPSTVRVPDVAETSLSEAKKTIEESGLEVGAIHKVNNDTVKKNHVIKTSPTIGSAKKKALLLTSMCQKAVLDLRSRTTQVRITKRR